jgi:LysR family transcriptional regulator, regulator for metE and metH
MEIRHLRLIKAIVEEGTITKAMDKLYLTQSALSYQLKEAEQQLGTGIFLRRNKKMILTKAGEKLYDTAIDVLEKLQSTEQEIKKLVFGETGEIKLSAGCYTSYHWLPAVLRQFHLVYPNIDVSLVMEATPFPLQKLLTGGLDVAVTTDPIKDGKIKYIELFQDEMVAVVADGHRWSGKKFVLAEDFAAEHLFIYSYPLSTVTVHQYFLEPAGVTPQKITPLPLTEACIEMVKAEMGIIVMARWAVQPYLKNNPLRAIKIGRTGLKRKHYLAILADKKYPDYFTHFIDFLRSEIHLAS